MTQQPQPQPEPQQQIATSSVERAVPKYCTSINIVALSNKSLVLSLFYTDPGQTPALIDRIIIDSEHAKSLHKALGTLLQETSLC